MIYIHFSMTLSLRENNAGNLERLNVLPCKWKMHHTKSSIDGWHFPHALCCYGHSAQPFSFPDPVDTQPVCSFSLVYSYIANSPRFPREAL